MFDPTWNTISIWLVVAVAVVGLALVVGLVRIPAGDLSLWELNATGEAASRCTGVYLLRYSCERALERAAQVEPPQPESLPPRRLDRLRSALGRRP